MLPCDTYFKILAGKKSLLYQYLISLFCPKSFTAFLHRQIGRNAPFWQGKRACFVLSFDVDYSEDVRALPQLIEILSRDSFEASFGVVGSWVVQFPNEHKLIAQAKYEIINHSFSHPDNEELSPGRFFNRMSFEEKLEEIKKCDDIIREILCVQPVGFRTPHFGNLHTEEVYDILQKIGYRYSSSTVAPFTETFGFPFEPRKGLWEFPVSTCPSHPFSTFDTWHSFRKPARFLKHGAWHKNIEDFLMNFSELVKMAIKYGSFVNLYFDPRDVLLDDKILRGVFDILKLHSTELWLANYSELVNFLEKRNTNVQVSGISK